MSGEGEIAREARRVFRKLMAAGAHLVPQGADGYRLVSRAELNAARTAPLGAAAVEAFVRRGWLKRAGAAGSLVLSDAGKGWYERATASGDPFEAQHQVRRTRLVRDSRGVERRVTVDENESPLTRLRSRGLIDAAQFEAGEKFRRDFTLAQLMPRLGVDYAAPMVLGKRGQKNDLNFTDVVVAARQRFAAAMRAVGPGLADLLFDVCCHLKGIEDAERANAWPSRSGRVVLGLALDRLAEHYGMRMRGNGKPRAWVMEDAKEEGQMTKTARN
jgi:hypothetical protein